MSNKLEIQTIQNSLNEFKNKRDKNNSRYRSWEHCIKKFGDVFKELNSGKNISPEQIDYLSLNLGFYLASWGMMRGSTELLQYDYKIHIPCVKKLLEFSHLFCIDFLEPENAEKLKKEKEHNELDNLCSVIRDSYTKRDNGEGSLKKISDTLLTKIIMGTLGIVPAYDNLVQLAIKDYGITKPEFKTKPFLELVKFFSEEKIKTEIENWTKEMKKSCEYYTPMKVIDSLLWELGKPIAERKKQEYKNRKKNEKN